MDGHIDINSHIDDNFHIDCNGYIDGNGDMDGTCLHEQQCNSDGWYEMVTELLLVIGKVDSSKSMHKITAMQG